MLSSAQADFSFWPESSSHVNVKATRLKHKDSGLEMSFAIYNGLFFWKLCFDDAENEPEWQRCARDT